MSTDAPNPNPSPETSPTSAPSGGPPTSSEFRFGDDAPAWARGKSASEVLEITTKLANVVQQNNLSQPPPRVEQPAPAFSPDDYITGSHLQSWGQQAVRDYVNPQLETLKTMTAQTNLNFVEREFADDFRRYGPEIHANLAQLTDKNLWTVDNLRRVVKFVKADHVEELAQERAARLVAEMEPNLGRSSGAPAVPVPTTDPKLSIKSESIPSAWRERAEKVGLTEQAVDEFCRANEMTREEFFKQFERTAITEVTRRG